MFKRRSHSSVLNKVINTVQYYEQISPRSISLTHYNILPAAAMTAPNHAQLDDDWLTRKEQLRQVALYHSLFILKVNVTLQMNMKCS